MTIPRATYRLQFHRGFTLRDALEVVPYLSALGISHVYASPLLKARPGSTHGYDVCDASKINPEVGSESDLEAFVSALREQGMGLVLDIVPNHMAAVPENPWWWDVLKHGRSSGFADHFDIDWDSPDLRLRGKVLLPVLGDEYEVALERGELKVEYAGSDAWVRYFDHCFPVSPASISTPGKTLEDAVVWINSNRKEMAKVLDQQHYRLAFWRYGDTRLNYRRFFNITHLAGVRVELPPVFTDTHSHILDWHQRGLVDGLRVDHPDGLHDPGDYLLRLGRAAPGAWIIVEKILEPGEDLPFDWPVAGTTGYDFLTLVGELFINPAGEKPLTEFYSAFTGEAAGYSALVRENKRWILKHLLAAETSRLVGILAAILARRAPERSASPEDLREALIELIACFPVYRTYAQADKAIAPAQDKAWIARALAQAMKSRPQSGSGVLSFMRDLLQLSLPGDLENEFVMRFQQLTGPAMAKGVEDTTYYCFNRFVALNEVGGDPARFGLSVEDFHHACRGSLEKWPNTMLSTSTHDTKRSEDVRARLALLSEIPERWTRAIRRWSAINEKHRLEAWPDRNAEYLLYQTLVGAWPLPLDRALAYMQKAAREAKQHTNWTDPNAAYEAALEHFITAALADCDFVQEVEKFVAPLVGAGYVNSLAQLLLKLTAPGVPDIYQGTDLWDWSLVDPDNRRPVDFALRRGALIEVRRRLEAGRLEELVNDILQNPGDGRIKLFVLHQTLQLRRPHEQLFRDGGYQRLLATGKQAEHVCAFARILDGATSVTVVPRLVLGLVGPRGGFPVGEGIWEDTRLILPPGQADRPFRNAFTREVFCAREHGPDASLMLAEVLGKFPVALLEKHP